MNINKFYISLDKSVNIEKLNPSIITERLKRPSIYSLGAALNAFAFSL